MPNACSDYACVFMCVCAHMCMCTLADVDVHAQQGYTDIALASLYAACSFTEQLYYANTALSWLDCHIMCMLRPILHHLLICDWCFTHITRSTMIRVNDTSVRSKGLLRSMDIKPHFNLSKSSPWNHSRLILLQPIHYISYSKTIWERHVGKCTLPRWEEQNQ